MDSHEQYYVKTCPKCKETKSFDDFDYAPKMANNCYSYCKKCRNIMYKLQRDKNRRPSRSAGYKYKYGITIEQKENLIIQQNGCCYLCDNTLPDNTRHQCIEHDETTKQVFGISCRKCNTGIAMFNHDPHLMVKVAKRMLRLRVKNS